MKLMEDVRGDYTARENIARLWEYDKGIIIAPLFMVGVAIFGTLISLDYKPTVSPVESISGTDWDLILSSIAIVFFTFVSVSFGVSFFAQLLLGWDMSAIRKTSFGFSLAFGYGILIFGLRLHDRVVALHPDQSGLVLFIVMASSVAAAVVATTLTIISMFRDDD